MQSFRTELENPVVEKDIIDLEKKIRLFREGQVPEEKFRSLRLARGIYGQRQKGVQMVRIKRPFGKTTFEQWKRIADISDEYATGNLHLTTRQDIQIHFVSLDRTPELWTKLSEDNITIREACGNTVRNVTGSAIAGIDPDEPFNITPYAHATFEYFLRNPVCLDMGRKFKISFSSSDKDTAWSFIHDVGLIPKIRQVNGQEVRGFKVLVGGGLGAQPYLAKMAFEFLEADLLIPYIESVLRVFDRYGERTNRNKARMKYLIGGIGMEEFTRRVEEERKALPYKRYPITAEEEKVELPAPANPPAFEVKDPHKYEAWKTTNVFRQKQEDYYAAYIRIPLGDISSAVSRKFIEKLRPFVANDVRITPNQGLLLKFIQPAHLPYIYSVLEEEGFGEPGFDSVIDVTACPGTDTCNLGISSSTGIAAVLEEVISEEFPDLIYNNDIKIKISGCMNSCGQHGIAAIGFHGSSIKSGARVLPALQVLLGGGIVGDGVGRTSDRIIKVPSKRGPDVLRRLLTDYADNHQEGETFLAYYDRQGNKYFYNLLKSLGDLTTVVDEDFVDWGREETFVPSIGVGECASVVIDLVATLLDDSEEKINIGSESLTEERYSDAIYHAYTSLIYTAKALLLDKDVRCNTHNGIISDFEKHFVETGLFPFEGNFKEHVLQINKHEPGRKFAEYYLGTAARFLEEARVYRNQSVTAEELAK